MVTEMGCWFRDILEMFLISDFIVSGYRLSTQAVSEEGIDVITSTKSSVLMDAISSSPSLESIAGKLLPLRIE